MAERKTITMWDPSTEKEFTTTVSGDEYIVTGSIGCNPIVSSITFDELKALFERVQQLEERLAEIYLLDKTGEKNG